MQSKSTNMCSWPTSVYPFDTLVRYIEGYCCLAVCSSISGPICSTISKMSPFLLCLISWVTCMFLATVQATLLLLLRLDLLTHIRNIACVEAHLLDQRGGNPNCTLLLFEHTQALSNSSSQYLFWSDILDLLIIPFVTQISLSFSCSIPALDGR